MVANSHTYNLVSDSDRRTSIPKLGDRIVERIELEFYRRKDVY